MMVQDRIARLQGLLARVQRNAAVPRPARAAGGASQRPEAVQAAPIEAAVIESSVPDAAAEVAAQVLLAEPSEMAVAFEAEAPGLEIGEVEEVVEIDVDDVVEVTEQEVALTEELAEERPPASSRRPKVAAGSMDEALASAAEQLEEEREAPLKTPPPESGRQVAVPAAEDLRPSGAPPDLEVAVAETPAAPSGVVPTAEQLGQTIELEEPTAADLELAAAPPQTSPPPSALEVELPLGSGSYAEAIEAPASARAELLRRRMEEAGEPAAPSGPEGVERLARPPVAETQVVEVAPAAARAPQTFLQLLDQALSLGLD